MIDKNFAVFLFAASYCNHPQILPNAEGWDCIDPESKKLVVKGKPMIPGTKCKPRCAPGFKMSNDVLRSRWKNKKQVKNSEIECNQHGEWFPSNYSTLNSCMPSSCVNLEDPEHGTLFPRVCTQERVPLNTQCLVLCSPGFYPTGGRIRTCSREYEWFPQESPSCNELPPTPRPYIHCPSDIQVPLKPAHATAYVKIPQPQANMEWHRYLFMTVSKNNHNDG